MACLSLPVPDLPTIPSPLSLPSIDVDGVDLGGVDFCCTFRFPVVLPPIPLGLPPLVLTPLVAAMAVLQDAMTAYLDQIQIPKCPLE